MSRVNEAKRAVERVRAVIDRIERHYKAQGRPGEDAPGTLLTRGQLMTLDDWLEMAAAASTALDAIEAMANPCKHCGGDNPRSGDFCSDAHRTAYGREHAPRGIVRSSRHLARGKVSIVTHFEQGETNAAIRFRVGEQVHVVASAPQPETEELPI